MPLSRREFIVTAATALPALGAAPWQTTGPRHLRILVLGGTGFIGPYVVRRALARGHEVTLFNRGRTNTHLFPDLEKLVGDRDGKLDALRGRSWDAVIDNTGYYPEHVRDSALLLKDAVGHYLFLSSRMVYRDFNAPDKREDAPLKESGDDYGARKVLCEREMLDVYGARGTVVRSTGVAGPQDRSDRFAYWVVRVDRGGVVLAPGAWTDPVQYIDVRDLAEFLVHMIEQGTPGIFNAAGPEADLSIAGLLHGMRAVTSAKARFTWVPAHFLEAQGVRPLRDVPMWTPPHEPGSTAGFVNADKAIAAGLSFRPLAVTARDTLDWFLAKPNDQQTLRRGLSPEREAEILAAWHAQNR
jgi:2'-hydroxyisoflavone reductase